jgi:hypothetical protein
MRDTNARIDTTITAAPQLPKPQQRRRLVGGASSSWSSRTGATPALTSSRSNRIAFPPFCPQDSELIKHLLQCALGVARLMRIVREHLNVNTLLLNPQFKSTDEQIYLAHGVLDELIQ